MATANYQESGGLGVRSICLQVPCLQSNKCTEENFSQACRAQSVQDSDEGYGNPRWSSLLRCNLFKLVKLFGSSLGGATRDA